MAGADPETKEIKEFFKALFDETDRGCVLVAAASMHNALGQMLRAGFKHRAKADEPGLDKCIDALLEKGPMPPIGTFYVRILTAYALGLINDPMRKTLDVLRGMRNPAAHIDRPFSLEDYDISPMLNTLSPSQREYIAHIERIASGKVTPQGIKRGQFQHAALWIIERLQMIAQFPDKAEEILAAEHPMSLRDEWNANQNPSGSSDDAASTA